jgi:hypothetical protein
MLLNTSHMIGVIYLNQNLIISLPSLVPGHGPRFQCFCNIEKLREWPEDKGGGLHNYNCALASVVQ